MYISPLEAGMLVSETFMLSAELDYHSARASTAPDPAAFRYIVAGQDAQQVEDMIVSVFGCANDVVERPTQTDQVPTFALTRAALDAATHGIETAEPEELRDRACLEAEMRLSRSLNFLLNREGIDPGHAPAAIIYDKDGAPFAFRKASGKDTAFAWRAAEIVTEGGLRYLPGNCFFDFLYASREDPLERYMGDGLLSLERVKPPEDVIFLRFSTELAPRSLARVGHLAVVERRLVRDGVMLPEPDPRTAKLRPNLPDAVQLNSSKVARQVQRLLKTGRAVSIRE